MRHSEYYERPTDVHDAADTWMGEQRLNHLYTGSDYFVGPIHNERVFQVYLIALLLICIPCPDNLSSSICDILLASHQKKRNIAQPGD